MNVYGIVGFLLKVVFPILIWISNSTADPPKLSETMIKMKAVKDRILNGYDKAIRPTKEGSNTTEVKTGLMPRQILEVDEEKALFVLDSYFFMSWEDPRLKWNSTTEYNGYLQLLPDQLWLPDITVHNSHSTQVSPIEQVLLVIASSGTVYWVPPIMTRTSCPSLLEVAYPYDTVTCIVTMGSWVHDGFEIDFTHGENLYLNEFVNINSRWELIVSETKAIRKVNYYEGYDEPYVSLDGVFPLKRRTPPEIEATRNPCILVMLLTLSIFWLPTNSAKKLILGGFLFIVLTVLLIYVAWSTKFPLRAVAAASFLQSTMYILATTLLLQILVIFNLCSITGPVRPPPAAMQFLSGPFGKYACLRASFANDNVPIDRVMLKEDSTNVVESPTPKDDWMLFAAGLDRLFFLLMSIAMIAVHHL